MSMTIIVPLDGSPGAERELPIAAALARRSGGSVVLFTDRERGVPADLEGYLDAQEARFGVQAEHRLADTHDVPASLASLAGEHDDPVIVMSSRGPTGIDEVVIGSITAETLRMTAAPVLLLGPHLSSEPLPADHEFETLLLCLDGSHEAETIVPVAKRWAALLGLTTWVVQVVEPVRASGIINYEPIDESGYVHRIATSLGGHDVKTEFDVLHDDHHHPARAILRYAEGLPRPIIAMTTHGRTGLRGLIAGDVTMNVVRHAACPVLVTRPASMAA